MKQKTMACPNCCVVMSLIKEEKKMRFRDEDIVYAYEGFICPRCGLEAGTLRQTATIQRKIAEAYRNKMGPLVNNESR